MVGVEESAQLKDVMPALMVVFVCICLFLVYVMMRGPR